MDKEIITKLQKYFEDCAREADGIEFWFARDLQLLFDYDDWRNFANVIEKAKTACKNSGQNISDHFVDVTKKVKIGSEAERENVVIMLSLDVCFLIAQKSEPRKEQIAFAQSYF